MSVNVRHRPALNVKEAAKLYSEKDGVPIKYVCTSAIDNGTSSMDIFYRETPHPEFGNRYFGLYFRFLLDNTNQLMITNADKVEELKFEMVEVNGQWHYSQDRHDFHTVGDVSIDGGRAYLKMVGNLFHPVKTFRVKNGEFIEEIIV